MISPQWRGTFVVVTQFKVQGEYFSIGQRGNIIKKTKVMFALLINTAPKVDLKWLFKTIISELYASNHVISTKSLTNKTGNVRIT
jgi:hypothetical protein